MSVVALLHKYGICASETQVSDMILNGVLSSFLHLGPAERRLKQISC